MAELETFSRHPGDAAPDFSLPGTDGRTHTLAEFADRKFLLVVFWCNHCPYVQAWEGRMIDLAREYAPKGVATVLINANETTDHPDDRFEMMVQRATSRGYPMPYLRDDSQDVARAYGALVTPHAMLFGPERRMLFQGRIDDNHERPDAVRERYLKEALDAAVAGRAIRPAERSVRGCSVKWRS